MDLPDIPAEQLDPAPVTVDAACHCGAVRLRLTLTEGWSSARRCDCSYCRRRGAVALTSRVGQLEVTAGAEQLSTYRFNTGVAEHHFCGVCGIYTHHRRRSNPDEYGVNAACLEGVSPFDFRDIAVNDGVHHPSDRPLGADGGVAGRLRYTPTRPPAR